MNHWLHAVKSSYREDPMLLGFGVLRSVCRSLKSFVYLFFLARFIDYLQRGSVPHISLLMLWMTISFLLQFGSTWTEAWIRDHRDMQEERIRYSIHRKLAALPYAKSESTEIDRLRSELEMRQITSGSAQGAILDHSLLLFESLVSLLGALVFMRPAWNVMKKKPFEAVILASFTIMVALGMSWLNRCLQKRGMEKRDQAIMEAVQENSSFNYDMNILMDHQSGKEIRLYQKADSINKKQEKRLLGLKRMMQIYFGAEGKANVAGFSAVLMLQIVLWSYLGWYVLRGDFLLAEFVLYAGASANLIKTFPGIVEKKRKLDFSLQDYRYYKEFLEVEEEKTGDLNQSEIGDIVLERLSFAYPNTSIPVLKDLNLRFEKGKKYAIVGENGSGKSTLMKLLCGLYEPTEGKILGFPISSGETAFYTQFSSLFQDYALLGFSLKDNVLLGEKENPVRLLEAFRESGIYDKINGLKDGANSYFRKEYDPSGVDFSGGEKHKLATARLLYRQAQVVIFDEPTADLDPRAEIESYHNLSKIIRGRTSFYVSHRLPSCKFCDEIVVLDQGRVVECGSHQELLEKQGHYYRMWQVQSQVYRTEN